MSTAGSLTSLDGLSLSSKAGLFWSKTRNTLSPLAHLIGAVEPAPSLSTVDKSVVDLTKDYVATARSVANDWANLCGKYQQQAAGLEACVEAFTKGVERLPAHWQDHATFNRRERSKVFRRLTRIISFIADTAAEHKGPLSPTLTHSTFAMALDSERVKIKHDVKYRSQVTGPYGCFRLSDTRDEFDYAVKRAEELDDCVQRMVEFLYHQEKKLSSQKASFSAIADARKATKDVEKNISSMDKSITCVSQTINEDLAEINKAVNQFDTLTWCITGLAQSVDKTTNRLQNNLSHLQQIECRLSAVRPFKSTGASTEIWEKSTAQIKEWDNAVVELVAAHSIRGTAFNTVHEAPALVRVDTIAVPRAVRRRTV